MRFLRVPWRVHKDSPFAQKLPYLAPTSRAARYRWVLWGNYYYRRKK